MKAYKKYKDSGVSWIGMVPEHFEIIRLKFLLNTPMQYGANESGSLSSKNAVRYVRITDITNDGVLKNDDENVYLELDKAKNYLLKNKDILFARSGGTVGKSFMYKEDYGECSFAGYLIKAECNQNKFIPEFLLYYTQSSLYEVWKNLIFIQSTIQNIGANKYSNMEIPVPMLNEQEAIVRYLDQKVGQIDGYVAAKEKQLELLDELKQKIIADAVTGKCPEAMGLGRTPQYKPTNILWISDIPENWDVKKIFQVANEKHVSNKGVNHQNLLSLSYGNIIRKNINTTEGLLPESFETYQIVDKGDIILRFTDLQNDHRSLRTGLVKETGIITSAYICISPRPEINSEFLHWVLHISDIKKVFYGMGGGLRQNLNYKEFKTFDVPIPPKEEQDSIVAYIDKKVSQIAKLRCGIEAQIKHLKEYKQTIISDAVTGKVKVPGV